MGCSLPVSVVLRLLPRLCCSHPLTLRSECGKLRLARCPLRSTPQSLPLPLHGAKKQLRARERLYIARRWGAFSYRLMAVPFVSDTCTARTHGSVSNP